jgi:hypothetical protein
MQYHTDIPSDNHIFVFGSNTAGRHGKGAALHARQHYGAKYGKGIGRTGNAYALPTKDDRIKSLSLEQINENVEVFIEYAKEHPELNFMVTRVGCGLAGYSDAQIAFMFKDAPSNCYFDEAWEPMLK